MVVAQVVDVLSDFQWWADLANTRRGGGRGGEIATNQGGGSCFGQYLPKNGMYSIYLNTLIRRQIRKIIHIMHF